LAVSTVWSFGPSAEVADSSRLVFELPRARKKEPSPPRARVSMVGFVPALQQRVLAMGFVKNNQLLHGFLAHPAGPFTSECFSHVLQAS